MIEHEIYSLSGYRYPTDCPEYHELPPFGSDLPENAEILDFRVRLGNRSEGLTNVTIVISMTDTDGRAFDWRKVFPDDKKPRSKEVGRRVPRNAPVTVTVRPDDPAAAGGGTIERIVVHAAIL